MMSILYLFVSLVEQVGHFTYHIVVYIAIAGECVGAFAVTGEFAYEVRVFDFFVQVADEGAACHV